MMMMNVSIKSIYSPILSHHFYLSKTLTQKTASLEKTSTLLNFLQHLQVGTFIGAKGTVTF